MANAPIGKDGIYYAHAECGCIRACVVDLPGKADKREAAKDVAEWTRRGLRVVYMPPSETVLRPEWKCQQHADAVPA